ncbi:uncharacterized protein LOC132550448 [Ylistrum balloti]|uniref:uncharacterized protein LOC132550448 n=1 Tax=Ylistrum balloti TaxID=509963 RepID=UPI002905CE5D|nr:uncharacterized protein LOC132550448 [Ylistrum balloti]
MVDNSEHLIKYRIDNGTFKTINSIGIVGCQKECVQTMLCQSISYNTDTLECLLGQYSDNKVYTGLTKDLFIRQNVTDSILESLGPCKSRPCASQERCVRLSNGNSTCVLNLRPIDLAVVIDGSKTFALDSFNAVLDCVRYLINTLFNMRLAVATFTQTTQIQMYFDQFTSKSSMLHVVSNALVYPDQTGNELGQALLDVNNQVFNQSKGDRPHVMNVLLIFLDADDMNEENIRNNSDLMKLEGTDIITVCIACTATGHGITQQVASEPLQKYMLNVTSSDNLPALYETLVGIMNQIL